MDERRTRGERRVDRALIAMVGVMVGLLLLAPIIGLGEAHEASIIGVWGGTIGAAVFVVMVVKEAIKSRTERWLNRNTNRTRRKPIAPEMKVGNGSGQGYWGD